MDTGCIPALFEVIENPVSYYVLRPDYGKLLVYSDCTVVCDPRKRIYYVYYYSKNTRAIMQDIVKPDELDVLPLLDEYRLWSHDNDLTIALDSLSRYVSKSTNKRMIKLLTELSKIRKHEQHLLDVINTVRNQ